MICVSIGEKTVDATVTALEKVVFAEIRLDLIDDLSFDGLERILNVRKSVIITFRQGKIDEFLRIQYLFRAIELGVRYLDIEIESGTETIKQLLYKTYNFETEIIISYHNFKETPPLCELLTIVNRCKKLGASLVKITTFVNRPKDNIILMELLEKEKGIIVIGMGKKGKISRVISVFLGSPFTFASLSKDKVTAEGQIDYKNLKYIFKALNE